MSSTKPPLNLFTSAGAKQTSADFVPAAEKIETNFGTLKFVGGSSPTAESTQKIYHYLTGNNSTVYAIASLDLNLDGPTVVQIPAGMMGNANDANFMYLTDFGPTGPDKGKGGKYLFLPPGHTGDVADGYLVVQPNGHVSTQACRRRRC